MSKVVGFFLFILLGIEQLFGGTINHSGPYQAIDWQAVRGLEVKYADNWVSLLNSDKFPCSPLHIEQDSRILVRGFVGLYDTSVKHAWINLRFKVSGVTNRGAQVENYLGQTAKKLYYKRTSAPYPDDGFSFCSFTNSIIEPGQYYIDIEGQVPLSGQWVIVHNISISALSIPASIPYGCTKTQIASSLGSMWTNIVSTNVTLPVASHVLVQGNVQILDGTEGTANSFKFTKARPLQAESGLSGGTFTKQTPVGPPEDLTGWRDSFHFADTFVNLPAGTYTFRMKGQNLSSTTRISASEIDVIAFPADTIVAGRVANASPVNISNNGTYDFCDCIPGNAFCDFTQHYSLGTTLNAGTMYNTYYSSNIRVSANNSAEFVNNDFALGNIDCRTSGIGNWEVGQYQSHVPRYLPDSVSAFSSAPLVGIHETKNYWVRLWAKAQPSDGSRSIILDSRTYSYIFVPSCGEYCYDGGGAGIQPCP